MEDRQPRRQTASHRLKTCCQVYQLQVVPQAVLEVERPVDTPEASEEGCP
eukprot:CAMPEP_0170509502 /NCGR_PEP_ID=MMETSP0208-20121228/65249_1 /TAXON_ID=197538 /ORGANISM="Strombidium inclinatum, Strain S3" /LENGTH=49 /DNA_ID=CAMNT_0010792867 /DNA_START=2172 /DNA_END=2321 /DNA_ORIENTATION=-